MKLLIAVMGVCVSTAAVAAPHEVSGATFEGLAGWEAQDAPDHATLIYKADNRLAIFVVFAPHPGTAAASFAADWKTATTNTPTPSVPAPAARKLNTRNILEGVTEVTVDGSPVTLDVQLVEVAGQVVPTIIYTQDRKMLQGFRGDVDKMLASIQVAKPPEPEPAPAPAPAPAPVGGARKLTTITLADIAGSWSSHDQAITTYVDSNTGGYSHTQATSVQDWYEIAADGSYSHRFQGLANGHVVRESSKGTVSLGADGVVFTEGGKVVRHYHFLELAIDTTGAAHWKLIDFQYPLNSANIGLYGETWGRAAPKK